MRNSLLIYSAFLLLAGITLFSSSCKKEIIEKTIVQQDTIFVYDTVTIIGNYSSIEEYNSGDNSELVNSLPITALGSWNNGIIYSLLIPNLQQGDIITVFAECEVSNYNSYDVAIGSQLILGTSPSSLPGSPNFYEISENNGTWMSANDVHYVINQVGTYVCPGNQGNRYVNFCALARTPNFNSGDALTVEQDYGRLSVIVYRK